MKEKFKIIVEGHACTSQKSCTIFPNSISILWNYSDNTNILSFLLRLVNGEIEAKEEKEN